MLHQIISKCCKNCRKCPRKLFQRVPFYNGLATQKVRKTLFWTLKAVSYSETFTFSRSNVTFDQRQCHAKITFFGSKSKMRQPNRSMETSFSANLSFLSNLWLIFNISNNVPSLIVMRMSSIDSMNR